MPLASLRGISRIRNYSLAHALKLDRLLDCGNGGEAVLRRRGIRAVRLDEKQAVRGVLLLEVVCVIGAA